MELLLILTKKEASWQFQKGWKLLYEIELNTEQVITSVIENENIWLKYRESEFFKNVAKEGIEVVSPKAA